MKSNFFELNYLWNDPGDTGLYRFGHRGFLEMDASNGPIHCSRIFNPMVQAFRDRIQLNFRVVIGRDYTIRFSDSSGKIVIECKIDAAGWVWINGRKTEIYMTYAYGTPSVDKTFGAVDCTRESDETEFVFTNFDFERCSWNFSSSKFTESVQADFQTAAKDIQKIEIVIDPFDLGSQFSLKSFEHILGNETVEKDTFEYEWIPVVPPADGFPYDHISETFLRPSGYEWLKVITYYGWVKLHFPRLEKGGLEFVVKTPDIAREAVLLLEEFDGTIEQGSRAHIGILRSKYCYCVSETKYSELLGNTFANDRNHYLEEPLPEADKPVHFRTEWDASGYRLWIDYEPIQVNNSFVIPFEMRNKPYLGIDTITIHPGMHGTRLTLDEKRKGVVLEPNCLDPHVSYWKDFRIYRSV